MMFKELKEGQENAIETRRLYRSLSVDVNVGRGNRAKSF